MNIPAFRWGKDQFASPTAKKILNVLVLHTDDDSYVATISINNIKEQLNLLPDIVLSSLTELIDLNLIRPLFDFSHFNLGFPVRFFIVGAYEEATCR